MMAKRHRWWGGSVQQRCMNRGCGWWRTPRSGRHGLSTTEMLYVMSDGETPPVGGWMHADKTPRCRGELR